MTIKQIDFLKYRYFFVTFSILLIVAGIFLYIIKGGFKYNVDFVGGAEIRIAFEKEIDVAVLRDTLGKKGWKDCVIQNIGSSNKEFLVRVGGAIENLENKFKEDIQSSITGNNMNILNIDTVGAEVGAEAQVNAIKAVFLSFLFLLLYIAFTSKFTYALGAIASLAHDLSIILVFILLFEEPMSLNILAAILTILGYSLNDTIVIFARIRENSKKLGQEPTIPLVNDSINQTLKRTLLVSFFTLLSVLTFYFLGGETLKGFAFVMIIGIIFGTYSSIYIASPVMLIVTSLLNKNKVQQDIN